MENKTYLTTYVPIDHIYWMFMIFLMPMVFVLMGILEPEKIILFGLEKGMFFSHIFILLLYIAVKKF